MERGFAASYDRRSQLNFGVDMTGLVSRGGCSGAYPPMGVVLMGDAGNVGVT